MAHIFTRYRVLYFIRGFNPTEAQRLEAEQYGPHTAFRNINFHDPATSLEDCEAVAGFAPPEYVAAFPRAVHLAEYVAGRLGPAPVAAGPGQGGQVGAGGGGGTPFDPFAAAPPSEGRRVVQTTAPGWVPQG